MQENSDQEKKLLHISQDNSKPLDYKDVNTLKKFISERSKDFTKKSNKCYC